MIKQMKKHKVGLVLVAIQFVMSILLMVYMTKISSKYSALIIAVLALFVMIDFMLQATKKLHILGSVYAVLMCIVMIVGVAYMSKLDSTIGAIGNAEVKIDEVSILVLKDSSATTVNDVAKESFGILATIDRDNTNHTIEDIKKKCGGTIKVQPYETTDELVQALYDNTVKVIILNEAFRELVKESFADFDEATKVLDTFEKETIIESKPVVEDTSKEAFSIYISGIDTYGKISKTSRSDVNIIATVNPNTHQILLTVTPRDYYVPHPNSHGMRDKLTHAGIYGVDCSIGALEMLYDTQIDYYFRLNFNGFLDIVNALGGVDVYSEYAFRSSHSENSYVKGMNHMNGEKALYFVRERYAFPNGDIQRGKNQQQLIKGIIDKAASPTIMTNFNKIMDSVAGSCETSMSTDDINRLIKKQIDENPGWDIVMINVYGKGDSKTTYSNQRSKAYVMWPDSKMVHAATTMIQDVMDGKRVTNDQFKQLCK